MINISAAHQLSLLLLIVSFAGYTCSRVQYHITPSLILPCPMEHCLTLSEFATIQTHNGTNISLLLLPGNHSLDTPLQVTELDIFVMRKYKKIKRKTNIICSNVSGRFEITDSDFVSITDIHFIGCGGNIVSKVKHFNVENTVFQRVHNKYTPLSLSEVVHAVILRSLFLYNHHKFDIWPVGILEECLDLKNQSNLGHNIGGALYVEFSNTVIVNSSFIGNAAEHGGALFACNSSVDITKNVFSHNKAWYGGVMASYTSSVTIENSLFYANLAYDHGGVIDSIDDSYFIDSTVFTDNQCDFIGGVMTTYKSQFKVNNCSFTSTKAVRGGVLDLSYNTNFLLNNSHFHKNAVDYSDGVVWIDQSVINIIYCEFVNNTSSEGAVIGMFESSVNIDKSRFFNNSAFDNSLIWCYVGSLNIVSSVFEHNRAGHYGGPIVTTNCTVHAIRSKFNYNVGSIYAVSSKLTFSSSTITNNLNPLSNQSSITAPVIEGGAITLLHSTLSFIGEGNILMNNSAQNDGGALLAVGSRIIINSKMTIAHNAARSRGGGISMHLSDLEVKQYCEISHNTAHSGGGVHASSSYVTILENPGDLSLSNNYASNGGAMYLKENSKLYILRNKITSFISYKNNECLNFTSNRAMYGGAVYIDDQTNTDACLSKSDCFMQIIFLSTLFIEYKKFSIEHNTVFFSNNSATERGYNVFGGLLDRCSISQFLALSIYTVDNQSPANGITYIQTISNMTLETESISSLPVKVCFCNVKGVPDCDYQPPLIRVMKGQSFSVSLAAVDQVNNSANATFISTLLSVGEIHSFFNDEPLIRGCKKLTYKIFSPLALATIVISSNGPCSETEMSNKKLTIQFLNCSCPVGFVPGNNVIQDCECICDPQLSSYISSCNSTSEMLFLKESSKAWITYINHTEKPGYVMYPNCPLDYCHRPQKNRIHSITFNSPHAADKLCAYNRSGILCGACQENLSLSLGSSRCIHCPAHWPAVLVIIVIAAMVAGILLVGLLLLLNMTVAVGVINSFIFYSNVFATLTSFLFPSSSSFSLPAVFAAWLNFDIGVDVCFFDGLDTYSKTWLQLAFPVYIITLVVLIIVVSEYSSKFSQMIGRVDPVATLATLILLSYAKLLSLTITVLSFAVLNYPNDSYDVVWLAEGNVKYFQGKHVLLAIVALLIILVGIPYTLVLFLWQWIVQLSKWRCFKWTTNSKLNAFIATYHAPFSSKYRYWTGLLLIVRVILYITASVIVSANPQTIPTTVILLVGSLLLLKSIIGARVYKKLVVDILDTVLSFNLLAVSVVSLYDFKTDVTSQSALTYTSCAVTLILLIGAICYQVYLLIKKVKSNTSQIEEEHSMTIVKPTKNVVTHSVVEIPAPQK